MTISQSNFPVFFLFFLSFFYLISPDLIHSIHLFILNSQQVVVFVGAVNSSQRRVSSDRVLLPSHCPSEMVDYLCKHKQSQLYYSLFSTWFSCLNPIIRICPTLHRKPLRHEWYQYQIAQTVCINCVSDDMPLPSLPLSLSFSLIKKNQENKNSACEKYRGRPNNGLGKADQVKTGSHHNANWEYFLLTPVNFYAQTNLSLVFLFPTFNSLFP